MDISNEKEFDEILEQISNIYERGKKCALMAAHDIRQEQRYLESNEAVDKLRELRDIACQLLKRIHHQNEN